MQSQSADKIVTKAFTTAKVQNVRWPIILERGSGSKKRKKEMTQFKLVYYTSIMLQTTDGAHVNFKM